MTSRDADGSEAKNPPSLRQNPGRPPPDADSCDSGLRTAPRSTTVTFEPAAFSR